MKRSIDEIENQAMLLRQENALKIQKVSFETSKASMVTNEFTVDN